MQLELGVELEKYSNNVYLEQWQLKVVSQTSKKICRTSLTFQLKRKAVFALAVVYII